MENYRLLIRKELWTPFDLVGDWLDLYEMVNGNYHKDPNFKSKGLDECLLDFSDIGDLVIPDIRHEQQLLKNIDYLRSLSNIVTPGANDKYDDESCEVSEDAERRVTGIPEKTLLYLCENDVKVARLQDVVKFTKDTVFE